ncbi:MAG: J domain-containing protein [Elainellaceae cyanobacterium]
MAHSNYYDDLEVNVSANQAEIKQAYRRLAKLFHPDSNQAIANHHRIAVINEAYEVLGDPERRQAYDRHFKTVLSRSSAPYRQHRAAAAQSQYYRRKQSGRDTDQQSERWLRLVYQPVNRLLCRILNPLEDQMDQLAADPFDDELMADFQAYLDDCREHLNQAQQFFRSVPNPANLAGAASSLFYCLNQTGDGIEELERFTYSYTEHYLHTGHELFRIARKLRWDAQSSLRDVS